MKTALLLIGLLASVAYGQQETSKGSDGVISHVVDGGGWRTAISLNNIDPTPSQYKLSFFGDNGSPLSLKTNLGTGSVIYGTIPPSGSVKIETAGTNAALSWGWALMETSFSVPGPTFTYTPGATVVGTAHFLCPPFLPEASEPLDFSFENKWAVPFDHLNGFSSGVALVNRSTYADITVFITFFNESGTQIVLDSFTLPRGNHIAFTLTQKYPQTAGVRGVMKIETSGYYVNVMGFHVAPNGVFSNMQPTTWF